MQAVLCPRGHHAVGFVCALGDEVVDEHADIRAVAGEHDGRFAVETSRAIDAGDYALRRRLFIAAAAVDLPCEEQTLDRLCLERRQERGGVDAVIFDRIGEAHDLAIFQAYDRVVHLELHVYGQRAAHALNIEFVGVSAFGLDEDLVAFLVGEADDLVLDGWAIARTDALDRAVEQRRAVEVGEDDVLCLLGGIGEVARARVGDEAVCHEGEGIEFFVSVLDGHFFKIHRLAVDTRRSARLEAACREPQREQRRCQRGRAAKAVGTHALAEAADDDLGVEIDARRDDDSAAAERLSLRGLDAADRSVFGQDLGDFALQDVEPRLSFEHRLHITVVFGFVRLPSQRADGGAFAGVEHTDLQKIGVRGDAHLTAERVYLADEVTLGGAADRGVARHKSDRVQRQRDDEGLVSGAREGEARLNSGVSRTDNYRVINCVELLHCLLRPYIIAQRLAVRKCVRAIAKSARMC